jgi:hypothetical protein
MSTLAYPRGAARGRFSPAEALAALAGSGSDVLLGVVVASLGAVLLAGIAGDFNVDSWLALVTGRAVWLGGIPHREALTAFPAGTAWTDQQWLSQLADYAIYRLGGLGLLGLVNVLLLVGPVAGATIAARRLGAAPQRVLVALPVCLALITPSRQVRTQELAIPLSVAVCWLLATDSRRPSARVWWCLPLLALWANVHGSVTLGALLVALRAATVAWERRRALARGLGRAWARPLGLLAGALAAPLVTPYGTGIVSYYSATLGNPALRRWVTEWQPVTAVPSTAAALLVLASVAAWSFWRHAGRTTAWEKLALLVLGAAAASAVRNALFFGLDAILVVPLSLSAARGRGEPAGAADAAPTLRGLVNGLLALGACVALLVGAALTLSRSDASLQFSALRPGVLAAVRSATRSDPSLRVFADLRFDDWLLWGDPALRGRVSYDVRYELLTPVQMSSMESALLALGPDWKAGARGDRLVVLQRGTDGAAVRGFTAEPGSRVLYDQGGQIVILRSARAAEQA